MVGKDLIPLLFLVHRLFVLRTTGRGVGKLASADNQKAEDSPGTNGISMNLSLANAPDAAGNIRANCKKEFDRQTEGPETAAVTACDKVWVNNNNSGDSHHLANRFERNVTDHLYVELT